jgi:hypothetical protein
MYGCETLSLILGEGHRLNRVLRRVFRRKRDEILGGWRKLHNEVLHNLYSSPNIINNGQVKEDEMDIPCSTYG